MPREAAMGSGALVALWVCARFAPARGAFGREERRVLAVQLRYGALMAVGTTTLAAKGPQGEVVGARLSHASDDEAAALRVRVRRFAFPNVYGELTTRHRCRPISALLQPLHLSRARVPLSPCSRATVRLLEGTLKHLQDGAAASLRIVVVHQHRTSWKVRARRSLRLHVDGHGRPWCVG